MILRMKTTNNLYVFSLLCSSVSSHQAKMQVIFYERKEIIAHISINKNIINNRVSTTMYVRASV